VASQTFGPFGKKLGLKKKKSQITILPDPDSDVIILPMHSNA